MKKTYICKGCGAEVHRGKNTCPRCGTTRRRGATDIVAWVLFALILAAAVYFTLFRR